MLAHKDMELSLRLAQARLVHSVIVTAHHSVSERNDRDQALVLSRSQHIITHRQLQTV